VRETCCIKMCDFPKMYVKGSQVPFCNFHYAHLNNSNPLTDSFKTPGKNFPQERPQTSQFPFFEVNQQRVNTQTPHSFPQSTFRKPLDLIRYKANPNPTTTYLKNLIHKSQQQVLHISLEDHQNLSL